MSPSTVETFQLQNSLFHSDSCFSQGYYDTMDAGFVDEENFLYIMSRSDDVINVAGHRLSSGALEEVRGNSACVFFLLFYPLRFMFYHPCFAGGAATLSSGRLRRGRTG